MIARRLYQHRVLDGWIITVLLAPIIICQHIFRIGLSHSSVATDEGAADFDITYDVETGGNIPLASLDVNDENWVYGFNYQGSPPFDLAKLLEFANIDYASTHFLDLGCGKGRMLLMASELGFTHVTGVEISYELARIAQQNVADYRRQRKVPPITVLTADVATFEIPPQPLLVYLYNPFGAPVMAAIIRRLQKSLVARPRRVSVVYARPELSAMWALCDDFQLVFNDERFHIYDHCVDDVYNVRP